MWLNSIHSKSTCISRRTLSLLYVQKTSWCSIWIICWVNTQHFSLKSNKDSLSIYASSKDLDRHFCKICGCHIFFKYKPEPENVYYCIALLNKNCHPGHNPKDEKRIFVGSKSCFHEIEDNLPKFDVR
jgi:hypothetical protein